MKKILGFTVLLIALTSTLLGAYYGMGYVTERTLKKNIAILNQTNGGLVQLQQYHRGWFRSSAELYWTVRLSQPRSNRQSATQNSYVLHIPLNIWHGPAMFVDHKIYFGFGYASSDVALPSIYEAQYKILYDAQSIKPILKISAFVNYVNKTKIQLMVPSFKLIDKKGKNQLNWLGMTTTISLSGNKKQLSGDLQLDGLSWIKNGVLGTLKSVSSHYKLHQGEDNFFIGKAHLSVPSLSLREADNDTIQMNGTELLSNSDIKKGLFSSTLSVTIKDLSINHKTFHDNHIDLSLKNIDSKALSHLNQKIVSMQQQSDIDRQRMLFAMIPDLPALLCKGATLDISNLEMGFPEGRLKANLNIEMPNTETINPFQLLHNIKGVSNVRLTSVVLKSWLQGVVQDKIEQAKKTKNNIQSTDSVDPSDAQIVRIVDEKIKSLVDSGVISVDGLDSVILFEWIHGRLLINHHAFTAAMFAL